MLAFMFLKGSDKDEEAKTKNCIVHQLIDWI